MHETAIAFDPGKITGIAAHADDGGILTTSIRLRKYQGGQFFYMLQAAITPTLYKLGAYRDFMPTKVIIERAGHFKSWHAAHVQHAVGAYIEAWAFELNLPVRYVSAGEMKKHATGKGNASKKLILEAFRKKWGEKVTDEHEVDAAFLLDFDHATGC